jgi:precorrin-8X/cobalt-precorrin-8 methylmutase
VPVGFIAVLESKAALAQQSVAQIRIEGRKGGSPVAAAIMNALLMLAWKRQLTHS